jgi:hypothetical protein
LKTTKDGSDAIFNKDSILEFNLTAVDVGKVSLDSLITKKLHRKIIQLDQKD